MGQNRSEAGSSLDRLLLERVLAILLHQVDSGATSMSVASSIYLSIANDLHVVLTLDELNDIANQFELVDKP